MNYHTIRVNLWGVVVFCLGCDWLSRGAEAALKGNIQSGLLFALAGIAAVAVAILSRGIATD